MKSLRRRLEEAHRRLDIPWHVIERDYLHSWVLAGMSTVEVLRNSLVFKGGTALKKCYFADYRFSEDLDFSTVGSVPAGARFEDAVRRVCSVTSRLLARYADIELSCARYTEQRPHPRGQEAFAIRARFPWQRTPQTRILVETTLDECVLKRPVLRQVRHEYGEPFDVSVRAYALEEIVAEKLRAILQQVEVLERRGWSRPRARDYYDLWRVLGSCWDRLELSGFSSFLRRKCAWRGVTFGGPDDFFPEAMLAYVEKTWRQWLGPLVPELPSFELVVSELRPLIGRLVIG